MDRVADGGEGWRIDLQQNLSDLGIFWLDPTHKPIDIGIEDAENRAKVDQYKKEGLFKLAGECYKAVRHVDLRMVDISDFLVVNIDLDVHACGTYEESFLANRQKKPVIIHMEQGKEYTPNWLLATFPHQMIFSTWSEVAAYLQHVASDETVRTFNRWAFFDFNMCRRFNAPERRL
jgi:nucleoside 2-deoxyribosyltransferase